MFVRVAILIIIIKQPIQTIPHLPSQPIAKPAILQIRNGNLLLLPFITNIMFCRVRMPALQTIVLFVTTEITSILQILVLAAIRPIITKPPIQTMLLHNFQPSAKHAIHSQRGLLQLLITTGSISRFILVNTTENGMPAPIAIRILQTIRFLHARQVAIH